MHEMLLHFELFSGRKGSKALAVLLELYKVYTYLQNYKK